jgi:hypothetical protein
MEDGLRVLPELIFSDIAHVAERLSRHSGEPADGIVMPDHDGVETVQALKALGAKIERVVIGDDRILERARRPACVAVRRDEVVELIVSEMNRLLDEQTKSYRSMMADCELYEASA